MRKLKMFAVGLFGGIVGGIFILFIVSFKTYSSVIAEWLSAIGTVGAVVVALMFSTKKNLSDIKAFQVESKSGYFLVKSDDNDRPREYSIDLNEYNDDFKNVTFKYKGLVRFYNPSDEPRSLINLQIRFEFGLEDTFRPLTIVKHQFIILSPKETKMVDVVSEVPSDYISKLENFKKIKKIYCVGTTENNKELIFPLME